MRAAAVALLAALLGGCGGGGAEPEPAAPPRTDVRVSFDADGPAAAGKGRTVRLTCPSDAEALACRTLESLPEQVLAGVPPDVACTEIFGGPESGRIEGVVGGRRVDAQFSRNNGCEIQRFEQAKPVLDVAAR